MAEKADHETDIPSALDPAVLAGLDALPSGITIWRPDRRLVHVNETLRRTLGIAPASGELFDDFVIRLAHSREVVLEDPNRWVREEIADFGREKSADYILAAGLVMNVTQRPTRDGGMAATYSDVTTTKRNEHALREAKETAEATDEAKSRFLRAANHDLRQPLASLKILIYSCMREADEETRAEMLHAMSVAALIMEDLLGALLQIGQLDAGRIKPRVTSFQLSQLFERLNIQFRHQAEEKGLRLRFVTPRDTVATDRALLERILSNFVANAIRFTEVGGVVIGCRKEGKLLRVEIVDTGRGIKDADRERVFDEFYRVTDERRSEKTGLGLGLNIVRRLADLLELPVGLRSRSGHGSIFSVTVPFGNIWHSEGGDAEISEAVAGEFVGVPVLLVEDDDILRRSMTQLLQRWGIEVHAAANEDEALRLARGGAQVRLIIADYNLTSRTGLEVVRELRKAFGTETPAFIVTADAEPKVLNGIREAGLPVLIKPASPPRLRVLMHNLLFEPEQIRRPD